MKHSTLFILLFTFFGLTSCFEKDEPLQPGKWNGQAFAFDQSIYYSQFFFSLSTNSIITENSNDKWDIAFECSKSGWQIRINSANLLGIKRTGSTDFEQNSFPSEGKWLYDKSDGNMDSTAIGKWVEILGSSKSYTNEVFLLGKYNGIEYQPFKKMVFLFLTDSSYYMKYADINGNNLSEVAIKKDSVYNQVYYSFSTNKTEMIEPPKNTWDLLFTQYTTTLYTDDGIAVPYFVRGTLINPYNVAAQLDTVNSFESITLNSVLTDKFNTASDIIGYDWKSVEIDEQSNSAKYAVRENYTYIIHNVNDETYKLKFTSFFNDKRTPGYPAFIFLNLE